MSEREGDVEAPREPVALLGRCALPRFAVRASVPLRQGIKTTNVGGAAPPKQRIERMTATSLRAQSRSSVFPSPRILSHIAETTLAGRRVRDFAKVTELGMDARGGMVWHRFRQSAAMVPQR